VREEKGVYIMEDWDQHHANPFSWGGDVFGCTHGSGNEDEGVDEKAMNEQWAVLIIRKAG